MTFRTEQNKLINFIIEVATPVDDKTIISHLKEMMECSPETFGRYAGYTDAAAEIKNG